MASHSLKVATSRTAATIADTQNHHLFQLLLYLVATAVLRAVDITEPIRKLQRRYRWIEVLLGEIVEIDREKRAMYFSCGSAIAFGLLVLRPDRGHSPSNAMTAGSRPGIGDDRGRERSGRASTSVGSR